MTKGRQRVFAFPSSCRGSIPILGALHWILFQGSIPYSSTCSPLFIPTTGLRRHSPRKRPPMARRKPRLFERPSRQLVPKAIGGGRALFLRRGFISPQPLPVLQQTPHLAARDRTSRRRDAGRLCNVCATASTFKGNDDRTLLTATDRLANPNLISTSRGSSSVHRLARRTQRYCRVHGQGGTRLQMIYAKGVLHRRNVLARLMNERPGVLINGSSRSCRT